MSSEIYIVPQGKRYFLIRSDGKRVGNPKGYFTPQSAASAKRFLINAKESIRHEAIEKHRLKEYDNHLRSF